jgi:hypothetical protein
VVAPLIEIIAFNTVDTEWPNQVNRVLILYDLDMNVFRGTKNLQLMAMFVIPREILKARFSFQIDFAKTLTSNSIEYNGVFVQHRADG